MTGFLNPRTPAGLRNAGIQAGAFDVPAPYSPIYPLTIQNPGADTGDLSGWASTTGIYLPTAVTSATALSGGPATPQSGSHFFRGSTSASAANSVECSMWQFISFDTTDVADIDDEKLFIDIGFWQRAYSSEDDPNELQIDFYNNAGIRLLTYRKFYETRDCATSWQQRTVSGLLVPETCRYFRLKMYFLHNPNSGGLSSRNGFVDSFTFSKGLRPSEQRVQNSRLYAVIGRETNRLTVANSRLYAVIGRETDRVAVSNSRLYAIIQP